MHQVDLLAKFEEKIKRWIFGTAEARQILLKIHVWSQEEVGMALGLNKSQNVWRND
jgi:hypothetical protein